MQKSDGNLFAKNEKKKKNLRVRKNIPKYAHIFITTVSSATRMMSKRIRAKLNKCLDYQFNFVYITWRHKSGIHSALSNPTVKATNWVFHTGRVCQV